MNVTLYTYTIAVCDHSGRGTHHVSSYRAPDVETAKGYTPKPHG